MNHLSNYTIEEEPNAFIDRAEEAVRSNTQLGFVATAMSDLPNQKPETYHMTRFRQLFTDEEGNQRIIGNIVDGRLAVISVGQAAITLAMRHEA